MNSALYVGQVQHLRLRPRRHHLRYRFFWMLLDLDELDALAARCSLFSKDHFNLFSFHQKDHLAGDGDLRDQIQGLLTHANLPSAGKILVMSMPRILGHIFNPISLFFCYDPSGRLTAMIYEVNNTFGQRHSYLFAAQDGRVVSHSCHKEFYVSPFMEMEMRYDFSLTQPGEFQVLKINGHDRDGLLIRTSFAGKRQELSDGALVGRFLSHPLLTLKVVAGIHIEALVLWLKGVRIVPRPPAPAQSVTFVK